MRRTATAVAAAAVLVASLVWAGTASGETGTRATGAVPAGVPAQTGSEWPDRGLSAPDEATAMRLAYRKRARVEVSGGRTGTSRTFANPDGTLALEQYATPQRVRRGADWVPVSTRLYISGGAVVPEATVGQLAFSAGGTGPMVTTGAPGAQLALSWPGPKPLPAPELDGATATYREVFPGVDLVLRAEVDGFRELLVVKTRQAAGNAALRRLAFPLSTQGLTLHQDADGVVVAEDGAGHPVLVCDGAMMWDSPPGGAPKDDPAGHDPEGSPHRTEKMPVQVSATELAVVPSAAMLAAADTVYPLFIDPAFNGGTEIWTHVSRRSPDTSYWAASNRDTIRVGQQFDGPPDDDWRAFVRFNTGVLNGSTILSASFLINVDHTADCDPSPVELWHTSLIATNRAITWNNMASGWKHKLQTVNADANQHACPKDNDQVEFGNGNVKALMQDVATNNDGTVTFGLRVPDEGDRYQWKKFVAGSAFMEVWYNRKPGAPGDLAIDSCYTACGAPAVVRSGTPYISARPTDPDGGTLRVEFEVYDNARTSLKARSGTAGTGVPSGSVRSWRIVPLVGARLPDGIYQWRTRGCDAYACGAYSIWFAFTVDTQDPSLPTVTSDGYPDRGTGAWSGGPGVPGDFTFTGTGATHYLYRLNDGPAIPVGAGTPQAEQMPPALAQVTSATGFGPVNATVARVTDRGHGDGDALRIAPAAQTVDCGIGCSYATVGGGGGGGVRLGMKAGKRYRAAGWIYVPSSTGLDVPPSHWGLSIAIYYKVAGSYGAVFSPPATLRDTWQRLAVTAQLPAGTTDAYVVVFNGFAPGQTGRVLYWDDLSLRELVGDTAVEPITPVRDGVNILSVQAVDAAGNQPQDPRIYEFLVRPNGDLNWYWSMDEGAGTAAVSAPTNNRPAAFGPAGVAWQPEARVGPNAVSLSGTGELTTAGPVLDTTHEAGFTVAAWVRLTDLAGPHTVLSQDGVSASMFRLGFRADLDVTGDGAADPAWCFTVRQADAAGAAAAACSTDWVAAGDWVHLVGIYDRPAAKIKLYVKGTPQIGGAYAEAGYGGGWSAAGRFAIGRAWQDGAAAERWQGDLDEVYAEQEVWSDAEIDFRVIQGTPSTGEAMP